ncbi:hypothetical protein SynRS9915_01618 [Synechococcus sp. RS9915]|nr:hypothetical protein SynRS9915_01618 [Synechococcus sp. RS9915]
MDCFRGRIGSGRRGRGSRAGFVLSAFDLTVDVDLNSFTTGLRGIDQVE